MTDTKVAHIDGYEIFEENFDHQDIPDARSLCDADGDLSFYAVAGKASRTEGTPYVEPAPAPPPGSTETAGDLVFRMDARLQRTTETFTREEVVDWIRGIEQLEGHTHFSLPADEEYLLQCVENLNERRDDRLLYQ